MVSIDPKHGKLKTFHKPLTNFKNHKPTTIETKSRKDRIINKKSRKDRIINNVNQFYKKFFDTCKKNYDSKKILTLTRLKYLVRKNKNQSRLKKILREMCKNHYGLE